MVFVDDLHIWKGRTDKAKALARDIVTKLGTQASMAAIFTSRSCDGFSRSSAAATCSPSPRPVSPPADSIVWT